MKILRTIFILLCFAYSGEVDHYAAWNNLPKDEIQFLNDLYNKEIQIVLNEINQNDRDCECQDAAGMILKHLGIALNSPIEKYLKASNELDKYPPADIPISELYKNSIYRRKFSLKNLNDFQDLSLHLQIDEIINVGGVYIGLDKLTHFSGSGYLYYQIYLRILDRTGSKETAKNTAIEAGVFGEKNILGKIPSGVLSYADLESNYQGFLFALDLCRESPIRLKYTDQGWQLSDNFDLKYYVNPLWDESYNTSYYYDGQNLMLTPKSSAVLENIPDYCEKYKSDEIQQIFTYYDSIVKPSYSAIYLKNLIQSRELPDPGPFNIRTVCKE